MAGGVMSECVGVCERERESSTCPKTHYCGPSCCTYTRCLGGSGIEEKTEVGHLPQSFTSRVTTQIIPSPQLDVPTHPKETKTNRQHYMRLQYTYATSTYMYTHICIHMSICTQPCRQKGSSAPTWSHSKS